MLQGRVPCGDGLRGMSTNLSHVGSRAVVNRKQINGA